MLSNSQRATQCCPRLIKGNLQPLHGWAAPTAKGLRSVFWGRFVGTFFGGSEPSASTAEPWWLETYVNVEKWFFDNITNQCNYCGCGFHTTIKNANITTNPTAQRVNNDYTHTLDNIIPYCKRCNSSCGKY